MFRAALRAGYAFACLLCLVSSVAAQTIAGGQSHTVMLKPDGTVVTFGNNIQGQLGDNTWTTRKTPIHVAGLSDVVAVAAGANHSLAVTSGGVLYGWGDNTWKQLGDGTTTDRLTPVVIPLSSVVAVAAGDYHTIALTSSGDVYSWGTNGEGQLGTSNYTSSATPVLVASNATSIGAGISHSLIAKSDGSAWATGWNPFGQLCNSSTTGSTSFVQMGGVSTAIKVAGGRIHSLILLSDGTMKACGYNGWGALGDGTTTQRTTAVAVSTVSAITAIAAGYNHSVARKSDGSTWVWGADTEGQLGDGNTATRTGPYQLTSLSSIDKIGAGHDHTLAVSSTGVVSSWGKNNAGQLGNGTTTSRNTPGTISGANYVWKVTPPAFSVAGGIYNTQQTVVVTVGTPGATIFYTQNGAEPTEADQTMASGASVVISSSQTLKARAVKSLLPDSDTTTATYTLKPWMPSYSPAATTYSAPQSVTMTTSTAGATMRYTTDGSTPNASSTVYSGALTVGTTTTLKAVAFKDGWTNSDTGTGTYTMNFGTLAAPAVTPAAGTYESSVTVEMTAAPATATIRYTTDGSTPSASSALYTAPVTIDTTKTVKAKAFHPDYVTSADTTRTFTITVAAPSFVPTAGTYPAGQTITVSTATLAATIRYTLNGDEPTTADPIIPSGGLVIAANVTLKAKAWKTGATTSGLSSATYGVIGAVSPAMIAAGSNHSLALRDDGLAWAWGSNVSGQVGDGTTTSPRLSPRSVAGLTGGAVIKAGGNFSLALKTDGTVVGFGYNGSGRLGDGGTTNQWLPKALPGLTGVTAIAAGDSHGVAVKSDGTAVAWGANGYGEIGNGTTSAQQLTPAPVSNVADVTAVAAGWGFTLARRQSGTIASWGYNGNGRLGDGSATPRSTAVTVSGITTATAIAAGWDHGLALLGDATVKAWGRNNSGQLGDGSITERLTPVSVTGLTNVVALAAGYAHSLFVKADGTVWSVGANGSGQLGDGTTTPRTTPVQVSGLTNIVGIAAGQIHSLALDTTGVIWVWGRNALGQLGDGQTVDRTVPYAMSRPGMAWGVNPPAIGLASGTYTTPQSATLTVSDPDATIRDTTDGTDPTASSPAIASGSAVTIDRSLTLKASAWKTGSPTSMVAVAVYTLQASAPAMTPAAGLYTTAQSVTLASSSPGVTIRYTLDGSEPTETSTVYGSPIGITTQTTLRARAFRDGWQSSASTTAAYAFNYGALPAPTVTPGSAT